MFARPGNCLPAQGALPYEAGRWAIWGLRSSMINAIAKNCFLNEAVQERAGKERGEQREANHLCLFSSPLVTAGAP